MSFSAEMKDFINAYDKVTGTNVKNQSVKQSEATTDETLQRTKRENDPARLATADKLAQLRVQKAAQDIRHAGEDRAETSEANKAYLDLLRKNNGSKALAVPGHRAGQWSSPHIWRDNQQSRKSKKTPPKRPTPKSGLSTLVKMKHSRVPQDLRSMGPRVVLFLKTTRNSQKQETWLRRDP